MLETNKLPSQHQPGETVYFQPTIMKADEKLVDDSAIPCMVVGVTFLAGKVLYDLALPNGEGSFYEGFPLRGVDSYFVCKAPEQ